MNVSKRFFGFFSSQSAPQSSQPARHTIFEEEDVKEHGGARNEKDEMDLDQEVESNGENMEIIEENEGITGSATEITTLETSNQGRKVSRKSHSKQLVPEAAEKDTPDDVQASANLFLTQPDTEEPKYTRQKRTSRRNSKAPDPASSTVDLPEVSEEDLSLRLEKKRRRSRKSSKPTNTQRKSVEGESEEVEVATEEQLPYGKHVEPSQYSQDMVTVMTQALSGKTWRSRKPSLETEILHEADDLLSTPAKLKSLLQGLGSVFEQKAPEDYIPGSDAPSKKSKKRNSRETVSQSPAVEVPAHNIETQLQNDMEIASAEDAQDSDLEASKPPSTKALGKRKASDTLVSTSMKRQKSLKSKIPVLDLETFGFTSSSSRRNSQLEADIAQQARDLYAKDADDDIRRSTSATQPPLGSLPPVLVESPFHTRGQRSEFAPISESSEPPHISAKHGDGTSKHRGESSRKARKAKEIATVDESDSVLPPNTSAEVLSQVLAEADDESGSDYAPEPAAFKSSERRKRRLPIGETSSANQPLSNKAPKGIKLKRPAPNAPNAPNIPKTPVTLGGRISSSQIDAIKEAVESFREQNDMSEIEVNAMIQKDTKEAPELWKHMFEEIQDITRRKLLTVCRRTFHNFEARGAWTKDQDEELREAYETFDGKWKPIGQALNRYHEDCRDRWRNYLICGDNMKKDIWDKNEEDKLREVVDECTEAVLELKEAANDPRFDGKDPETLIDWNVVSSKMGYTRSRLQCVTKWKKLKDRRDDGLDDPIAAMPVSETWRLEAAEKNAGIMNATEKLEFLYLLRDSGAGREGRIPWPMIQAILGLKGQRMVLKVCFRRLKEHVPDYQEMKLQDIVQFLIDDYEAAAPNEPRMFKSVFEIAKESSKKRGKRKSKSTDDSGEGSSRTKPRKSKYKTAADAEKSDTDAAETPSNNKKKRKLHHRMKSRDEEPSHESESQHPASESSITAAFNSLRDRRVKTLRATRGSRKKPALSEYRVVESEESEGQAAEQETHVGEYEQEVEDPMVENELLSGTSHQDNGNSHEKSEQGLDHPMDEDVNLKFTPNQESDEEEENYMIDDAADIQGDSDNTDPHLATSDLPIADSSEKDDDSSRYQKDSKKQLLPQVFPDSLNDEVSGEEDSQAQSQSEADERSPPPTFHRAGSQRSNQRTLNVNDMTGDDDATSEHDEDDSPGSEDERLEADNKYESEDESGDARAESSEAEDEIDLDNNTRHFRSHSVEPDTKTSESSNEEEEGHDVFNTTFHTEPSPDLDNQDEPISFHSEASPDLDEKQPALTNGSPLVKMEDSDEEIVRGRKIPLRLYGQDAESPPHVNGFTPINAMNSDINGAISSDDDDEDIPAVPIPRRKAEKERRRKDKRSAKRKRMAILDG